MAIQPQLPGSPPMDEWKDVSDVPELAFQNVGYAIMSMDKTGMPTPLTQEDLRVLLVVLRGYVPRVGDYLDGA